MHNTKYLSCFLVSPKGTDETTISHIVSTLKTVSKKNNLGLFIMSRDLDILSDNTIILGVKLP